MFRFTGLTALALAALGAAAPAAADDVLTVLQHTDEIAMMGQRTPAQDVTHSYWFGEQGTRMDMGETSVIMRLDQKKLYFVDHDEKTYSTIDLPFDFKQLVGAEMAPMMEQMAGMMKTTVTPSARTGNFAGFDCKYVTVTMAMGPMSTTTSEQCMAEGIGIDYSRYKSLVEAQSELVMSASWMKELAKIQGFPVRSDSTTQMMGKTFKSWQELKAVEEKAAPAGHYEPPAGYREVRYDPMAQAQQRR